MFGYVKALPAELKVKEYELYQSTYCGLCHHIKERSFFMTFSLSYDFVLPCLFSLAFTNRENIVFKKKRCLAHPFKRRNIINGGKNMQRVADAAILLMYYKLRDDISDKDGSFFKRLVSNAALPFAKNARKKVLKNGFSDIDETINSKISALSLCEKEKSESVYDCAAIFGELLSEIFSIISEDESEKRCLEQIGYRIGRWIYIADAVDDIPKDKKTGSYNPFILSGADLSDESFRQNIELSLTLELSEGEKALDLLNIHDTSLKNIIENIFYLGMPNVIHGILYPSEKEKP